MYGLSMRNGECTHLKSQDYSDAANDYAEDVDSFIENFVDCIGNLGNSSGEDSAECSTAPPSTVPLATHFAMASSLLFAGMLI